MGGSIRRRNRQMVIAALATMRTCSAIPASTAVRLRVDENQLLDVFGEIRVLVDGLKGA